MEITVLGCFGPFPAKGEATSGYLIRHGKTTMLIDCGAGIAGKLAEKIDFSELDDILFTHLHYDHMSDVFVLGYYYEINGGKPTVYVPAEEQSEKRGMLSSRAFDVRDLPEKGTVGDFEVSTFAVKHPVPCRGIRLKAEGKTFVFTGDTNYFDGLAGFCQGADVLFADSAFTNAQWGASKPHMSAALCGKLAAESRVTELYLTHLNPGNDPGLLLREAREACEENGGSKVRISTVHPGMTVIL